MRPTANPEPQRAPRLALTLLALLVFATSLRADPPAFDAEVLAPGVLNPSFRDLGPCGELVGSQDVLDFRSGERRTVPLRRRGGRLERLEGIGTTTVSIATEGEVIVGYFIEEGSSRPAFRSASGQWMPLPTPEGVPGMVSGIDQGARWVSGYSYADPTAGLPLLPIVWRIDEVDGETRSEVVTLPLGEASWGMANGVNRVGDTVGILAFGGEVHAVVWRLERSESVETLAFEIEDLGVGYALGITESGFAVGSLANSDGTLQAFAARGEESFFLGGSVDCPECESFAFAANSRGQFVGHAKLEDGSNRAMLWRRVENEVEATDLSFALPPELAETVVLDSVNALNDAGEILASGSSLDGRVQVLLTPRREVELDQNQNGLRDFCETESLATYTEITRLAIGDQIQVHALATLHSGEEIDVSDTAPVVSYASDREDVLRIGAGGLAEAVAPGRAVVQVRYAGRLESVVFVVGDFSEACLLTNSAGWNEELGIVADAHCSQNSEEIVAARWDFGDGTQGEGLTVEHFYAAPGRYLLSLDIEDANGLASSTSSWIEVVSAPAVYPFQRGDANRDAVLDLSDAIMVLRALFTGGVRLYCEDSADSNDDGRIDLSDAVAILSYLYLGGDDFPAPGIILCGDDPTPDALGCENADNCEGAIRRDPITGFRPNDYDYERLGTGTRERPRPAGGRPMHTGVAKGDLWNLDPDGDDPRDTDGPFVPGEEIDSEKERPLIVVPGIMATALVDPANNGSQVWPPYSEGVGGRRPVCDLFQIPNKVPSHRGSGGLIGGFYNELLGFLVNELEYKEGETLFVFPYDWTRSNKDSGQKLAAFIRVVMESRDWEDDKVDVVCHSMGGLVTRAAVIFYGAPIHRTAYLASPHYGASKAYFALHDKISPPLSNNPLKTFAIQTLWDALVKGANEKTMHRSLTDTAQALPSAWELLPDDFYFDRNQSPARYYGQKLTNAMHNYYYDWLRDSVSFPTAPLQTKARVAMRFKEDLGLELPGDLNAVLYNRAEVTLDHANWTSKWYWWNHGFDSPMATAQGGDGTVPTESGRGPGTGILVPGAHTALPNLRPTFNVLAAFLR